MTKDRPWTDRVDVLCSDHVEVFRCGFGVTEGHLLFVPIDDTRENVTKAFHLAQVVGDNMLINKACDGYNIGLNRGQAAGQSIKTSHVHLIPRRLGDMEDPTGGVRGVIPERQNYKTSPLYVEARKKLGMDNENTDKR